MLFFFFHFFLSYIHLSADSCIPDFVACCSAAAAAAVVAIAVVVAGHFFLFIPFINTIYVYKYFIFQVRL